MAYRGFSFIVLCFLGVASWAADPWSALHLESLHGEAPDLAIRDSGTARAHLHDYRGKAVILHLWASWCKPCQDELPELRKLAEAGASQGVIFLPVSVDEPAKAEQAREFLRQVRVALPFWIAEKDKGLNQYLTWGLPVTYFIDASGNFRARTLGACRWGSVSDPRGLLRSVFPAIAVQNK